MMETSTDRDALLSVLEECRVEIQALRHEETDRMCIREFDGLLKRIDEQKAKILMAEQLAALAQPAPNAESHQRQERDAWDAVKRDHDNAAIARAEEAPSEALHNGAQPCCGDFAKCSRPCTPRGIELGKQIEEARQRYIGDGYVDRPQAVEVSVDDLGWHKFQCPLCDGNLMCAKEALLAAAWCCEEGQRLGVKVCPACAATGAAYTAAMSPEQP